LGDAKFSAFIAVAAGLSAWCVSMFIAVILMVYRSGYAGLRRCRRSVAFPVHSPCPCRPREARLGSGGGHPVMEGPRNRPREGSAGIEDQGAGALVRTCTDSPLRTGIGRGGHRGRRGGRGRSGCAKEGVGPAPCRGKARLRFACHARDGVMTRGTERVRKAGDFAAVMRLRMIAGRL
jgi:hypothetical protein